MEIMTLAIAVFAVIIGLVIGYVSISARMKSSQEAAELMLLNAEQEATNLRGQAAVSYTHLDVYKRQVMPWWSMSLISLTLMALSSQAYHVLYRAMMSSWWEIKKISCPSQLSQARLVSGSWNVPTKKGFVQ